MCWRCPFWCGRFVCVVGLSGAFDAYTWHRWFSSIVSNLELNLFAHVAAGFGTDPVYYYLVAFAVSSAGLAYFGVFGLLLYWRRTWPIWSLGLAQLVAFSAIGHKELRFGPPLVPVCLVGLGIFFTDDGKHVSGLLSGFAPRFPVLRRLAVVSAAGVLGAAIAVGVGTVTGRALLGHEYVLLSLRHDLRQAYLFLSLRSDVRGVIDDSGVDWWNSGGYYDLHQSTPIYLWDLPATGIDRVRRSPQLFASHWLTRAEAAAPEGYLLLARFGRIAIWRRSKDPPETLVPPGYSTKALPPFDSKKLPPKVAPRW